MSISPRGCRAVWRIASCAVAFTLVAMIGVGRERGPSLGVSSPVEALPLYAARAGRTCDNCHADPTGWKDPALKHRKCNLSCMTCHINPTGGGVRNAAGRYYSQATLPMWFPSHRPYKDLNRHIPYLKFAKHRKNRLWDPAFGRPAGGTPPMAYDDGRYNGLHADPMVLFGIDTRVAIYHAKKATLFFPMQYDVHAAVHPYKHLTAMATGGVLAKWKGLAGTFERQTPFMVKDTFLMLHELPYMSYVKVGRFVPAFGTYLDDHTSPTRRDFELDSGVLHSRVTGIEVGLAPNYPFVNLSVFRPNEKDSFSGDDPDNDANPPFFGVSGWGAAMTAGWRDLGYNFGVSGLLRQRDLQDGGDTQAFALHWAFNPWFYLEWLPLTYMGEVAVGARETEVSGKRVGHYAAFHELDALVRNGVNLRIKYDFADPDVGIRDDHYHRLAFGGDLMLLPGFGVHAEARVRLNAGDTRRTNSDLLIYMRGWY